MYSYEQARLKAVIEVPPDTIDKTQRNDHLTTTKSRRANTLYH